MAQLEPPQSPTVAQRLRRASTSVTGVVQSTNADYPAVTMRERKAPAVLEGIETITDSAASVDTPSGEGKRVQVPAEEEKNRKETSRHAFAGLNIVAWGAMLFFLLLNAAPAMDYPNKDSNDSSRKKWIEVDNQILNALFCVTGFGLAPWRFRALYWMVQARRQHNQYAMMRLCKQNETWFRPPRWYHGVDLESGQQKKRVTFKGEVAPPTRLWKLGFVVWMMLLNTLFQCALSGMMWGYNRINRPTWAAGTFSGLGCGVALLAGIMMWWEGRRVKKIEGPPVVIDSAAEKADS